MCQFFYIILFFPDRKWYNIIICFKNYERKDEFYDPECQQKNGYTVLLSGVVF